MLIQLHRKLSELLKIKSTKKIENIEGNKN